LYWGYGAALKRSDLNGHDIEDVFTETGRISAIAIDWIAEKIYWANPDEDIIARVDFDGGNREELVNELSFPTDIELNLPEGRLYWTDQNLGVIQRARINPFGEIETIYSGDRGPAGLGIEFTITADVDIKPGSCPNPVNRNSNGVLPVALVGTDEFDVTQVDVGWLELSRADGVDGSVAPLANRLHIEDVATPFDGEPCDCHELDGDGVDDLSMKFDTKDVVAELQLSDLPGGTTLEFVVSGELLDGTPFTATDCVRLVPQGSGSGTGRVDLGAGRPEDLPADRRARPGPGRPPGISVPADDTTAEATRLSHPDPDGAEADRAQDAQDVPPMPIMACGLVSPALLVLTMAGTWFGRCWRSGRRER
jgi:hypothetical protein